jgi:NADH-quinone oxidoreductase subunit G
MTVTSTSASNGEGGLPERPADHVTVTIDGIEMSVPKGLLVIRAAEQIGVQIPRFCEHPLLDPIGACRQCLVEVEGQRKPLAACTTTVTEGMIVRTQMTSPVAEKAQAGNIEFLLVNHPLDCPICDKGGECPLQNQSMANGYAESRFHDVKRTYPKPIAISSQILLDRERCVLCTRCTRFAQQIAGDPFIELFERGALEQVAIFEEEPFESYFGGNTVQICPVGALTGASYRFRARPFDLVSTPSICEHCASGCQQRTDWRRGKVMRRLAGDDPEVNEEWNCDKGRWAFTYAFHDRVTEPRVRDDEGYLQPTSWSEALAAAAQALTAAGRRVGVLTGGRLTVEDAYAYAKFARVALGTNDIDFRARPHSVEEQKFLAARVAGRYLDVTYADLEDAPAVLLVGFEPEEESPIVFLRLRKASRKALQVFSIAPFVTPSVTKTRGRLLQAVPGDEARVLAALSGADASAAGEHGSAAADALRTPGAVILVGERMARVPGALTAAARLADATGAKLAWVPRRAGERGALDAGCLPDLLPGGRPLADADARRQVADCWAHDVPAEPGRDATAILQAVLAGEIDALIVAGVDPADTPDPQLFDAALDEVPFVVSIDLRESPVTLRADVVLPVAPAVEKGGTYLDWEGRVRSFEPTLRGTGALPDFRVLHTLAEEMGLDIDTPHLDAIRDQIRALGAWNGARPAGPSVAAGAPARPGAGEAVLATWHWLLDDGRLQDHEPHLAGTRRQLRLHLSPATAQRLGVAAGDPVTVSTDRGSVTAPLVLADLPDDVVWLPTHSPGSHVREQLGADHGGVVRLSADKGVTA